MPVMPLPGAFPAPGAAQNSGFFPQPAAQPQTAPGWQNPGLGQTILESIPQPQPQAMPPHAPMPTGPESFLPQRRNDGHAPFSGNMLGGSQAAPQAAPAQAAWGAGFAKQSPASETILPPQRHGNMPGHSTLIPGAPTLPMMGGHGAMGESSPSGTLLSRTIHSAPLAGTAHEKTGGLSLPVAASHGSARSRPLAKPKRATNVFMIGLALLFLGGFLVAAGWLFREPLLQVVAQVKALIPGAVVPAEVADIPEPAPTEGTTSGEAPPAKPEIASTPPTAPASGSFDPDEAPPQTKAPAPAPAALPKVDDNVAMVRKAEPVAPAAAPAPSSSSAGGLVEVKPAAEPGMPKANTAPDSLAGAASQEVRLDEVTEEAKPAAEALQKFLSAASFQERIQYTLAANVMRSTMERYYSVNPDGPIVVDAIALVRYDPKPQVGGGAHAVFGLESKTWEFPVPVMLEMHEGSFKVDWLSFVEFKDRILEKFLSGYQDGPARFHVGITRTHYFEDKVPNASNKDAFRISPAPPNPFASVVFVDRDSDVGRELRDKIPWGAQVWAIVELEWTKLGPQSWVQLAAVPQLNWYSVPNAPKAQRVPAASPIADDAQVPTETQKAVPVGR
jgi:hypothetical protein